MFEHTALANPPTVPIDEVREKRLSALFDRLDEAERGSLALTREGEPIAILHSADKGLPNVMGALGQQIDESIEAGLEEDVEVAERMADRAWDEASSSEPDDTTLSDLPYQADVPIRSVESARWQRVGDFLEDYEEEGSVLFTRGTLTGEIALTVEFLTKTGCRAKVQRFEQLQKRIEQEIADRQEALQRLSFMITSMHAALEHAPLPE